MSHKREGMCFIRASPNQRRYFAPIVLIGSESVDTDSALVSINRKNDFRTRLPSDVKKLAAV